MTVPKIFDENNFNYNQYKNSLLPALELAQSIFETWLKENSKVVYGEFEEDQSIRISGWHQWADNKTAEEDKEATHQAFLVCIEPIAKPKCEKHEPVIYPKINNDDLSYEDLIFKCKHCGVKLRPVYQECE